MRSLFTYQESIHFIAIFSHKHFQVAQWLPVSAGTATGSSEAMSSMGSETDEFTLRQQMSGNALQTASNSHQCGGCKLWFTQSCC
jgi:hypothetical protein